MSQARDLAEHMAFEDLEQSTEAVLDRFPVERVRLEGRIDMKDGSWLQLASNRIAGTKTGIVTFATMSSRGWDIREPDAEYIWLVRKEGSDDRPRLIDVEG